jgi:hypothetical protein
MIKLEQKHVKQREIVSDDIEVSSRLTKRLRTFVQEIGFVTFSEGGERLSAKLGIKISEVALLRSLYLLPPIFIGKIEVIRIANALFLKDGSKRGDVNGVRCGRQYNGSKTRDTLIIESMIPFVLTAPLSTLSSLGGSQREAVYCNRRKRSALVFCTLQRICSILLALCMKVRQVPSMVESPCLAQSSRGAKGLSWLLSW